ncbi:lysosomal acid glucosylceramidase-like [Oppia nitens]|uniref:lysosomal acid glucosylceramidase-like n=1 Tax=Oppia nitens TaxID=1686743 RepID=UPI0023DAEBF0|nr:lysosomal acid glucosylceramidase-like [Oppia nitens]
MQLIGLILVVISAITIQLGQSCLFNNYGYDSAVCVCNDQQCDGGLAPIRRTRKGVVTAYVTNPLSSRFKRVSVGQKIWKVLWGGKGAKKLTLTVNCNKTYQSILGFGGAFTDAAGIGISSLTPSLQSYLISDYYSADGLEYNLGRIPIGGTDFSTHGYAYDEDHKDDFDLKYWNLTAEDYKFKIPFIREALSISAEPLKLFTTSWSPPVWMKNNTKLAGGGFLKDQPGEKYYQVYANYIVKFINAYKSLGIPVWGLTPQNEPYFGIKKNGYPFNNLQFNGQLQRDFIKKDLGPALVQSGNKDIKVMTYDDQTLWVQEFAEAVLKDPEANKFVSGIAFHGYFNNISDFGQFDQLHKQFPDKFILATELCLARDGDPHKVHLGAWEGVELYANDIIKDLNNWVNGWVDWNLALDEQGGPNWFGGFVDSPIIVNTTGNEYYKQPMYYALAHFTKFLSPDSVRIGHSVNHPIDTLMTTAFKRPDGGRVVIVLNKGTEIVDMTVVDKNTGGPGFQWRVYPKSLQTFIYYNN